MGKKKGDKESAGAGPKRKRRKIPADVYEAELFRLQTELVRVQEWTRDAGAAIVVVFEGRDAAGNGGTIKRITGYLSPRVVRIAARAGVENVMGFCTPQEHSRFVQHA